MENISGWMPVAVTLLAQTAGVVWWASNLSNQVAQLTAQNQSEERTITLLVEATQQANERLTRVQTIQDELRRAYGPIIQELQHRGQH